MDHVRVPKDNMLGPRGGAFLVVQTHLGDGRIHHAMRTVGQVQRALDMMLERAVSRHTQGEMLGRKTDGAGHDRPELDRHRVLQLLVLHTVWKIDRYRDYKRVRKNISTVKALRPRVFHDVAARALQIQGSLGVSNEMPFAAMVIESFHMGLADGPTEVHKATLARGLLFAHAPNEGVFPSGRVPTRRTAARERFAELLERSLDDKL